MKLTAYGWALLALAIIAGEALAATQPGGDPQAAVAKHNEFRAKHLSPPLQWRWDLAGTAQAEADRCDSKWRQGMNKYLDQFDFKSNVTNTAVDGRSREPPTWDQVVYIWYIRNAHPGDAQGSSFSQVVWAASKDIGCAVGRCGPDYLYVCAYDPPGNVLGSDGKLDFVQMDKNVSPADAAKILNLHNKIRGDKGLAPLSWDGSLGSGALQWSAGCHKGGSGMSGESWALDSPSNGLPRWESILNDWANKAR